MLKRHGHVHLLLGVGYVHLLLFPNLGTFDVVPQNVGTRIKVISQSRIIDNFHVLLQGSNTIKQIHLAQNRTNKKQELLMECLTKASQSTTLKVDLPSSGIDLGVIINILPSGFNNLETFPQAKEQYKKQYILIDGKKKIGLFFGRITQKDGLKKIMTIKAHSFRG